MNMLAALHEASERIQALDFSADNERIAFADQHLVEIDAAMATARQRETEIVQLLASVGVKQRLGIAIGSLDGTSVADALLLGRSATDAAAETIDRETLERERDALRDGIRELASRKRDAINDRKSVQNAASRRAFEEFRSVIDAELASARAAAKIILDAFASVSAIGRATNSNPPGLKELATAVRGLHGPEALLPTCEEAPVPSEVLEVIGHLSGKGSAYSGGLPKTVQVYDRHAAAALSAAMRTIWPQG